MRWGLGVGEEDDVPGQYSRQCAHSGSALRCQHLHCDQSLSVLHTAQETKSVWGSLCA